MITSIWAGPGGDFAAAKAIRQAVFVEELGMDPALGWDTTDDFSFHLVLLLDGEPVATGRITYGGVGVAALGRICVLNVIVVRESEMGWERCWTIERPSWECNTLLWKQQRGWRASMLGLDISLLERSI